jgi:HEPN domain-containing protein
MARSRRPSHSAEVRRFHRAGRQRLEEAQFLLREGGYTTAAVYLGGYGVECALKALVLSSEPGARHRDTLRSFRGVKAHDFEWLRQELARRTGAMPREMIRQLARASAWTTDLRYSSRAIRRRNAEDFLAMAEAIFRWAEGRL